MSGRVVSLAHHGFAAVAVNRALINNGITITGMTIKQRTQWCKTRWPLHCSICGLSRRCESVCLRPGASSDCLFRAAHSDTATDLRAKLIKSEIEITRSPDAGPLQRRPPKIVRRRKEKVAGIPGTCAGARAYNPGP